MLPNGNIVVTAPGPITSPSAGAAYLYSPTGVLISTLTGEATDGIGSDGIVVLKNGNYLIVSRGWNNGKGAVTWGNGSTGVSGTVSADNSLVNTTMYGFCPVALSDGNYVVISELWRNDSDITVGAITLGDGAAGTHGLVSAANSLVGSASGDNVGNGGVVELQNGNFVIGSRDWSNGDAVGAGAATWCSADSGCHGIVSSANSLVGDMSRDSVGSNLIALSNGNYVVSANFWHGEKGAATWGNGVSGTRGFVTANNSLIGSAAGDRVGESLTALASGNYVVGSPEWQNGAVQSAGAATWGNGNGGTTGLVTTGNSLVGTATFDEVGTVTALTDGSYVVATPRWNNSTGAVTWSDGNVGITGTISPENSLVGAKPFDFIGSGDGTSTGHGVVELANGNYVVSSFGSLGLVTWIHGNAGFSGTVSATNSLTASNDGDMVGRGGVVPLSNGNYVVSSPWWNSGIGATTWGNGSSGTTGTVSPLNSIPGGQRPVQLDNGNYVVFSSQIGDLPYATAFALINGATSFNGNLSSSNAITSTSASDADQSSVRPLKNSNFVIAMPYWDNGGIADAGAIAIARGTGPISGNIGPEIGVVGNIANAGPSMVFDYDAHRDQLVVGLPAENKIALFKLDLLFRGSFD